MTRAKFHSVGEIPAAELRDGHVLVQISYETASEGPRIDVRPWEQALSACCRGLGVPTAADFATVSVTDEVLHHRTTIAIRNRDSVLGSDGMPEESGRAVSNYMARGILLTLHWLSRAPDPRLPDLLRALKTLAAGTMPTGLSDALSPDSAELIAAVVALEQAIRSVNNADHIEVVTTCGSQKLDPGHPLPDAASLRAETKLSAPAAEVILIVEQPDYSASGRWAVRHGSQRGTAISDSPSVFDGFHRRETDIRPGDAMQCRVRIDRSYDATHELVSEQFRIVELVKVFRMSTAPLAPTSASDARRPVDEEPLEEVDGTNAVLETIEGDFGTLTLRQIPID
jgi:hypothetical protein